MTTMMHLANYMMQKEFLMRILNRLDVTLTKSVKLPLKNTMLAKVLGPISGKNVDAVVCGILQQHGLVSIDYHDIKDLYDADSVNEVRIKGKGANDEEQIQSIIDDIRNEYQAQLRSSKKVVVTLCGSSDPSGLLEKLSDCMDGLNVVWQTRNLHTDEKDMELSLVYVL